MKQLLLVITASLALTSLAGAATYEFTIADKFMLNGKECQPGTYKVEVKDKTAFIRMGKDTAEIKIRTESAERKYDYTSVRLAIDGDKRNLEEIHIGGTKTKLVVEEPKTASGGF